MALLYPIRVLLLTEGATASVIYVNKILDEHHMNEDQHLAEIINQINEKCKNLKRETYRCAAKVIALRKLFYSGCQL